MTRAYYNEHDEFAASWLRNLIAAGHVADGEVDTRSIVDVRPDDLRGFGQCHFFAGIGGWSYALRRAGWADSSPVWTGSCPCQPFSLAGAQRGFDDERHLWPVWRELIRECGPAIVFGEQVASATEWLGLVRGDLEEMGRAVGAIPIQAASAGADHLRDRYWFVADADDAGSQGRRVLSERASEWIAGTDGLADAARDDKQRDRQPGPSSQSQVSAGGLCAASDLPDSQRIGVRGERSCAPAGTPAGMQGADEQWERLRPDPGSIRDAGELEWVIGADGKARRVKPGIRLLAHGVPNRVGLLRGFGNAIDHRPAAAFIESYMSARKSLSLSSHNRAIGE
jgi:DNA (cytosine-5)-methyltransferase 1